MFVLSEHDVNGPPENATILSRHEERTAAVLDAVTRAAHWHAASPATRRVSTIGEAEVIGHVLLWEGMTLVAVTSILEDE